MLILTHKQILKDIFGAALLLLESEPAKEGI